MRLVVKGSGFSDLICQEIAAITDHAILDLTRVVHDKAKGTLELSITRFPFQRRMRFFGTAPSYIYDKERGISTRVRVAAITSFSICNNYPGGTVSTIVFQGLSIRGTCLYLCSPEEFRGVPLYALEAKVSSLDLEICDEAQGG